MSAPSAGPSRGTSAPGPLDPALAEQVRALAYRARTIADGVLSGAHRSPHRGASVVFVEHREYRPGDDLRLLDWRAAARTDRLVLKRFEQETQLKAHLVLDRSASMAFPESPDAPGRKIGVGATLLAAFAYLLLRQGDAVGAAFLDGRLADPIPARSRPAHLEVLLRSLAEAAALPAEEAAPETRLRASLFDLAERTGRRGLVVLASDLLDDDDGALDALGLMTARGHDVVVFQVLTPIELDLTVDDAPARYLGLEGEPAVEADPSVLAAGYRAEVADWLEDRRRRCVGVGARWILARTDAPPENLIAQALGLAAAAPPGGAARTG